jgi:hypothetical protein
MAKKVGKGSKADMTPAERAGVHNTALAKLKELLKDIPVEVIGHIDSTASCCRNGTVALVEIDMDKLKK